MNVLKRFFCIALMGATTAFAAPASFAAAQAKTITVHGTGSVSSVPTRAEFTFGVTANGKTATAALAANAKAMTTLIAVLKARGIAEAYLQTAQISLSPNRNPAGNLIFNYTASNSVTALIRSIAKAGPIIDAAVRAGANDVQGPLLTSADSQLLSRRALTAAVADARKRAEAIASAAHLGLGGVVSVSELSNNTPLPFSGSATDKVSSTPIVAGTIQTQADVVVVFAIR